MPGLLALLAACAALDDVNTSETRLATIPADVEFKPDGPQWHVAQTDAVFRPDGRQVAYPARKGDSCFVMFGDERGPGFHRVWSPVFSPEGRTYAYPANDRQEVFLVTPEKRIGAGEGYRRVGSPVFSPDGRTLAFVAWTQASFIVAGDRRLGLQFDDVVGDPVFSPDSRRIAYPASLNDRVLLVVDDKAAPGDYESMERIVFSPDGRRLAFVERRLAPLSRARVICDDRPGPEFGEAGPPVFSPDSRRLAYAARMGGRWHCVVEGVKGKDHDRVGGVAFSPDGRESAYWARQGVDGPYFVFKGDWQSLILPHVIWGPVYSPDGKRVAFAVRTSEQRERVQIMDESVGEFDEVWEPRFIDGGRKLAFGARQGRDLWWKVVPVPQ